ncbi:hypothetical protein JCM10207_001364 [Rhodosporidiobolus poonsookiae]
MPDPQTSSAGALEEAARAASPPPADVAATAPPEQEVPSVPTAGIQCMNGCGNPAQSRFTCKVCLDNKNKDAMFCGNDCFVKNYKEHHRKMHVKADASKKYEAPEGTYDPFKDHRTFDYTGPLRAVYPNKKVPKRAVPGHIRQPDYAKDGTSRSEERHYRIEKQGRVLSKEEQDGMRKVCRLGREVLDIAAAALRPGITTLEIDEIVHRECMKRDAYPSPLNYANFPRSVCTSINEVICHGIPDARPLQDGDIINLDVSLYHGGYHSDLNATYPIGSSVPQENLDLIACSRACLDAAILACKPGTEFREVGRIIEEVCTKRGFSTNKTFVGHGVNHLFHCLPNIPHYATTRANGAMRVGQAFTIEPMICVGSARDVHWPDNWTAATIDGKCSAQFEETLLITPTGVEVLTAAPGWSLPGVTTPQHAGDVKPEDAAGVLQPPPGPGEGAAKKKKNKKKKAKKAAPKVEGGEVKVEEAQPDGADGQQDGEESS